jgi:hypothetical protein
MASGLVAAPPLLFRLRMTQMERRPSAPGANLSSLLAQMREQKIAPPGYATLPPIPAAQRRPGSLRPATIARTLSAGYLQTIGTASVISPCPPRGPPRNRGRALLAAVCRSSTHGVSRSGVAALVEGVEKGYDVESHFLRLGIPASSLELKGEAKNDLSIRRQVIRVGKAGSRDAAIDASGEGGTAGVE